MPVAHLVGVSIPRSGHHFLVSLLRETFGSEFGYCEFYTPTDCCRSVPCTRVGAARVFYQKSHDFDLAVPADLPGIVYVVQYRDPAMALLSDREYLATLQSEEQAADRDEFVVWLGRKGCYFARFFDKWVRRPRPNHVQIEYDELVEAPGRTLGRLFSACELLVPEATVAEAIERASPTTAFFPPRLGQKAFSRRKLESSRFLDPELMPVAESLLLDRIGELAHRRRLSRVAYRDHPVTCVFLAEDARRSGDLPEALHQIERALATEPRNRHLLAERCDLLALLGRSHEAMAVAEEALAMAPSDPLALRRLSDVHSMAAREHLASARAVAERLIERTPEDPGSHVHLAWIALQLDDRGAAQRHANRGLQLGSQDPDVWRVASEIFVSCQNWPAAIEAVRGAISLDPTRGEFHHHLANTLTLAGRPDEAEASHRRAVAMCPDRPGWRWKLADDLRTAGNSAAALEVVREALTRFPDHPALLAQLGNLTRAQV